MSTSLTKKNKVYVIDKNLEIRVSLDFYKHNKQWHLSGSNTKTLGKDKNEALIIKKCMEQFAKEEGLTMEHKPKHLLYGMYVSDIV